jgi:signal transduction histidine kinase
LVGLIGLLAIFLWQNGRRRIRINHKLALQNQQIVNQRKEITAQNENLSRRNQELQDINHEKDTLMSIVAHDLKSPLNRIFGLTRVMEIEGGLQGQQQEYVKLIKTSTREGLDLITDLLDVNSIEEGKLHVETFPLDQFLNEIMKSFEMTADLKSIQIKLINQIDRPISTDKDYLTRILDNLISNAIKFSPKGLDVFISFTTSQNLLCVSVKDQGPGFSDLDKKSLFQKFKKLSARPTGGETSNGLGLAIVKTLVDRLNGTVELISEPGKGSEFIVKIPNTQ